MNVSCTLGLEVHIGMIVGVFIYRSFFRVMVCVYMKLEFSIYTVCASIDCCILQIKYGYYCCTNFTWQYTNLANKNSTINSVLLVWNVLQFRCAINVWYTGLTCKLLSIPFG